SRDAGATSHSLLDIRVTATTHLVSVKRAGACRSLQRRQWQARTGIGNGIEMFLRLRLSRSSYRGRSKLYLF
ncbi:hypothetical protein A245_36784, partial [Pseudomonas syringae pv. actinidiae ICMP 19096]